MNIKNVLLFLFISLIFIIVYNRWIFGLDVLTSGDWIFIPKDALETVRINYFSIWLNDSFGRVLFDGGQAPTWIAYGVLSKYLSLGYAVSERLIHFWPIIIFLPLSSYFFLRYILFSKIAIFVGILIYSFNTYFLILQTGHLTLMVAFAIAPLAILFFFKTLDKLKFKYSVISGLLLSIVGAYEPRALYLIVWLLFFYFLFYLLVINSRKHIILKLACLAFLPILIVGLLNLYWIFGLISLSGLGSGIPSGRELFGSEFTNIFYATTLHHPYWTGSSPAIFVAQIIKPYFWLFPIIAFLGLYLNRKNKIIVFFGLIAIVGIFLVKQEANPFQGIYPALYKFLPGFSAFRESSKFYIFISLGYSVLISGFIDWLLKYRFKNTKVEFIKYIVMFGVVTLILINTLSLVNGNISTLFIPRHNPQDYILLENTINSENNFYRTLWIPVGSRWSYYSDLNPRLDAVQLMNLEWKDLLEKETRISEDQLYPFDNLFNLPKLNNIFNNSSIKYIIIPLEDNENDDNFFPNYGKNRSFYIYELNKLNFLKRKDLGTQEIVVYENKNFKPHIYLTNQEETIQKSIKFKQAKLESKSPTKYEIYLKKVKEPVYLNFSENYHPDWKLRVGGFNWFDALVKKDYFLTDENHSKNDAGLNSFYIDPDLVCPSTSFGTTSSEGRNSADELGCKVNEDGSYDLNITLYFSPQSYFYLGLIISLGTLIILISYLVYEFGKYLYERKN